MKTEYQIRQALRQLPAEFMVYYKNKDYARAKHCYDTARTVALFIELEEKEMTELFGDRELEIEGSFREDYVQKAYWECIKAHQSSELKPYPGSVNKKKEYGGNHTPYSDRSHQLNT